jgi:prepilin-type N-terminal cleavage/methylation domain-containing protein
MTNKSDKQNKVRNGFTMIEILVATSLALIIMLAVTKLFQQVQTAMNATTATMQMMSSLTNTKMTLERDIANRTIKVVKPFPQQDADFKGGYFCYEEGEMWQPTPGDPRMDDNANNKSYWWPKCSRFIGYDPDNYESFRGEQHTDKTLGDTDDILSLTVEQQVRGKILKRGSDSLSVVTAKNAEVIWFMRGNTLYRRVLLVGDVDGRSMAEIVAELEDTKTVKIAGKDVPFAKNTVFGNNYKGDIAGTGFHTFFDVSVRKERPDYTDTSTWELKFNTLKDLEKREFRYANYLPYRHDSTPTQITFPYSISSNDSWYFLRRPTLQETSHPDWKAGVPMQTSRPLGAPEQGQFSLMLNYESPNTAYTGSIFVSGFRRRNGDNIKPYWDYRNAQNRFRTFPMNDTTLTLDKITNSLIKFNGPRAGEDVVLTNVLSFDVKAWSREANRFIDLGEGGLSGHDLPPAEFPLHSMGRYGSKYDYDGGSGNIVNNSLKNAIWDTRGRTTWGGWWMHQWPVANASDSDAISRSGIVIPSTYDTWTPEYQMESQTSNLTRFVPNNYQGYSSRDKTKDKGFVNSTDPEWTNFTGDNWVAPPPYDEPLTGIQITIRVFEPRSGNIREVRVVMDLTK